MKGIGGMGNIMVKEYTSKDGEKFVGEWKDDKEWNGNEYNKDGKIISKYVDGKEIKLYPP